MQGHVTYIDILWELYCFIYNEGKKLLYNNRRIKLLAAHRCSLGIVQRFCR